MRPVHSLLTTTFLIASCGFALAAANQAESDRVKAAFERILSATPGVVTVGIAGDDYDLTLDAAPLIALAGKSTSSTITPMHFKLKPLGDGKWQVDQGEPVSFTLKEGDATILEYKAAMLQQTGVFDEALGAFTSGGFEIRDYTTTQDIIDPTSKAVSKSTTTVSMIKGTSTGKAGQNGGLDYTGTYETRNAVATITVPGVSGGPPINIEYAADAPISSYSGTGLRTKELTSLVAWFVAHPSEQAIKANQGELKSLLRSALPLWETMQGSSQIENVRIKTPYGNSTIAAINFVIDANGLTKDGKLREGMELKGVQIPTASLPAWSQKLIPHDASIDFTVSGFDAAAVSSLVLDVLDLEKRPPFPDQLSTQLMTTALPNGVFDIALNPGKIASPTFVLSYEGKMKASLSGIPSGTASIRLKGFDATIQALQTAAASDPSAQQVIGPLMMAKGFAKVEGDELVWAIESNGTGSILVNGVDVTKM
jgi:hypothetical protein